MPSGRRTDSKFFIWEPRFSLGVEHVDPEHQRLFEAMNGVYAAMVGRGAPAAELQEAFRELAACAQAHFEHEERWLESIGYPGLAHQRAQHARYMARLGELAVDRSATSKEALTLLREWFLDHVLGADRLYAEWAMERGLVPRAAAARGTSLLDLVDESFTFSRGHPLPLGATAQRGGINFAVFSRHAEDVRLVLFRGGEVEMAAELPLDARYNRTGDVWHAFVTGLDPGVEYGWRADGPRGGEAHRFTPDAVLVDPYARALTGAEEWGRRVRPGAATFRSRVVSDEFAWDLDQPLNTHLADSVIYEVHVRGFTAHPSARAHRPGTFQALVDRIPYLRELGVSAIELMPVTEFDECDVPRGDPTTGEPLRNLWGYHPISFFAPKSAYAGGEDPVRAFKAMVKAMHAAGIEVVLDMVFNHTSEGDERGSTQSLRGLDNSIYYMLDAASGSFLNFSGCGNTLNCNHPVVRNLILDALRYWVTEMHVDGFRFDLASVLGRGRDGAVLSSPPLLETIAEDPVLGRTKLIAEAWDAAGLYQVGSFPHWGRWAEWNGRFRDDVRRFVRGEAGMTPQLATRLAGSSDLYQGGGRAPFHGVNFVTCHDGFTLADLTSYDRKHNQANGEDDRDGQDDNLSWNCGVEGPTASSAVQSLRRRQQKNFAALLLLSQGVPMILAGDELGRTQHGNNNAYCQDNATAWLDWGGLEASRELFRFFQQLIAFRRAHRALRQREFLPRSGPVAIAWYEPAGTPCAWSPASRTLGMHLSDRSDVDLYLMASSHWEEHRFLLPAPAWGRRWLRFLDTALPAPEDILEDHRLRPLEDERSYAVGPRSVAVLVGR